MVSSLGRRNAAARTPTLPRPELSSPMLDHDMASLGHIGSHHDPRPTARGRRDAFARNVGTCRLDAKGTVQVGRPEKDQVADTRHRGGAARSGIESSVGLNVPQASTATYGGELGHLLLELGKLLL